MAATRHLYLARHAEAGSGEVGLSAAGELQAELLGERLSAVPLDRIVHGPLLRAARTAQLVAGRFDGVPVTASEDAGDFVPYAPTRAELPADAADLVLGFLEGQPHAEPARARRALERFTGPAPERESHELVVTHAFLVAWIVRAALDAPPWRWLGLNAANAALTVICYTPGRPVELLKFNDTGHLRPESRP